MADHNAMTLCYRYGREVWLAVASHFILDLPIHCKSRRFIRTLLYIPAGYVGLGGKGRS